MEGFVLELNKRETAHAAQPATAAPVSERHAASRPTSTPLDRSQDQQASREEGIGTFRGLAIGIPIAIGMWLAIIGTVAYVIA